MNKDKILGMVGLARRAGAVSCGAFLASRAITSGKAMLVMVALDASKQTKRKFKNSCEYYGIEYREVLHSSEMSRYTGKENAVVISIDDANFTRAIINLINS